jgi:hypothetical protein
LPREVLLQVAGWSEEAEPPGREHLWIRLLEPAPPLRLQAEARLHQRVETVWTRGEWLSI